MNNVKYVSWDSSVSVVTRPNNGKLKNQSSIPTRGMRLFSSPYHPAGYGAHPALPMQWVLGALYPGVKQ
jgi:hypothetical protein